MLWCWRLSALRRVGCVDADVGDVPFEGLVSVTVATHRVDGETVPKNRAQRQKSDTYGSSHVDFSFSAPGCPAAVDHFTEDFALPIVEDPVDLPEGGRDGGAHFGGCFVDARRGSLKGGLIELGTAHRTCHVPARLAHGSAEPAGRVFQLVQGSQD